MTTKRLKILIIVMSIILIFMLGFNLWHGEDIITEQDIQPTTGALSVWATTVDNVEETIIYTREMTEKRLAEKVNSLVGNESISYAIVHECATQVPDNYVQCLKSAVWVANAESSLFTKWMSPSNNWWGLMYKWKKRKFSSIEESVQVWVSLYKKNNWGKRTSWSDWVWTYCMSECKYWAKNYESAVKKLDLD